MTQQTQAISDDQELANVLKGMQQSNHTMATSDPMADHNKNADGLDFEASPAPGAANAPVGTIPAVPTIEPVVQPVASSPAPAAPAAAPVASDPAPARGSGELESIKKEALEELRPLVNKLNLPPKEKFDTMLLIIRSTDDKSLLEPAHAAAKAITDEVERAQALLDVIKEIDYFSNQH